jgi:hypothetical protein
MKFKDVHDNNKNLTEIVRNNEELENTISKIIENDTEDNDNIVNMLRDMMVEGKERVEKLLNTHRAASAPTSRAASTPIRSGSGECVLTGVFGPRVEDKGKDALEAEAGRIYNT